MQRDLRYRVPVTYLDTASFGLPPASVVAAVRADLERWAAGDAPPPSYDPYVDAARASFARLMNVGVDRVAVGSHVSGFAGAVAAALEPGARVLCPEGDFASVLFPFLARGCDVVTVPLGRLADAVDGDTAVVAFSAVQSSSGLVADLDAIADAAAHHGVLTFVDATQAAGWLPLDASRFDALVAHTYKWLVSPRGAALMTVSDRLLATVEPTAAGWYAADGRWGGLYAPPMLLAPDARRLDTSPAWSAWVGTAKALELFEERTVEVVNAHDVALANAFRAAVGLEPSDSAIVSIAVDDGAEARLADAGIRASLRAGRLRLSFHLHNTPDDVERVVSALGRAAPPSPSPAARPG
jgi:selenocysteine lyase/cysteine desulfurase